MTFEVLKDETELTIPIDDWRKERKRERERMEGRIVHSFMLSYPLSFVRPGTCCASSTG